MTPNTPVTNALGWHGRIVERPKKWAKLKPLMLKNGTTSTLNDDVVYVQWRERKDHPGGDVVSARVDSLIVIP